MNERKKIIEKSKFLKGVRDYVSEYSGHFLLLMMVVFGTIIDESPKKSNLYFPTKKCPISKKFTLRKAVWHFPHQARVVKWIKV